MQLSAESLPKTPFIHSSICLKPSFFHCRCLWWLLFSVIRSCGTGNQIRTKECRFYLYPGAVPDIRIANETRACQVPCTMSGDSSFWYLRLRHWYNSLDSYLCVLYSIYLFIFLIISQSLISFLSRFKYICAQIFCGKSCSAIQNADQRGG